ncbi:MAG: hypothetical protein P8166_18090 [Candidatus Thiodiazotropha sp.]
MRRSRTLLYSIFITLVLLCFRVLGDETQTTFYVVDSGSKIHQILLSELSSEIARRQIDNVRFVTKDELRELNHKRDQTSCILILPVGTEITKAIIDQASTSQLAEGLIFYMSYYLRQKIFPYCSAHQQSTLRTNFSSL